MEVAAGQEHQLSSLIFRDFVGLLPPFGVVE
jgi:hypothetical protein